VWKFCQVFGLGVLKKLAIEWNKTADSRMVLTERLDITTEDEVQNIAQTWTGILASVPDCDRGTFHLKFGSSRNSAL
jgi:hypothetical protein